MTFFLEIRITKQFEIIGQWSEFYDYVQKCVITIVRVMYYCGIQWTPNSRNISDEKNLLHGNILFLWKLAKDSLLHSSHHTIRPSTNIFKKIKKIWFFAYLVKFREEKEVSGRFRHKRFLMKIAPKFMHSPQIRLLLQRIDDTQGFLLFFTIVSDWWNKEVWINGCARTSGRK